MSKRFKVQNKLIWDLVRQQRENVTKSDSFLGNREIALKTTCVENLFFPQFCQNVKANKDCLFFESDEQNLQKILVWKVFFFFPNPFPRKGMIGIAI